MKILQTFYTPQESVNDNTLTVLRIHFKNGDFVKKDSLIAELDSSKALIEITSDYDGYIEVLVKEGSELKVGVEMFKVFDKAIDITKSKEISKKNLIKNKDLDDVIEFKKSKFSKKAFNFIKENNVDINNYKHLSYITTKDLKDVFDGGIKNNTRDSKEDSFSNNVKKELKSISKNKIIEFKYLQKVNSSSVISRLSTFIKIENKELISIRQKLIKSTPLPSIVYEVSRLLLKYKNLNSFYFKGEQAFYNNINVGIALDDGINDLKVASIFDSNKKSIHSIEKSIINLSTNYVNNKLSLAELSSSTFTITDLFNSSISNFYPLVNVNNSCILGISSFYKDGFNLDLSFDHRITNGKEISLFLNDLKERIESRFLLKNGSDNKLLNIKCFKCFRHISEDLDGQIYFQKVINKSVNSYICSNCLSGW